MKQKIAVIAFLLVIFTSLFVGCFTDSLGNAPGVTVGDTSGSGIPTLTWNAYSSSEVRIIDGGLHPKQKTVTLDFGYNTEEMKNNGYTTLNFKLKFNAFIDNGLMVNTNVNAYFTDGNKKSIGVSWELAFTNTSTVTYTHDKTINISNLIQNRGKIYLTFEATKNSFQTGTHISNIELTITAQ